MKKLLKDNKGITLVALVITIIIMIILAGVTMNVLLGENGLINKAKDGASKYEKEAIAESVNLAVLDATLDGNGRVTETNLRKALNDQIGEGKYVLTDDSETGGWIITIGDQEFKVTPTGVVTGDNSSSGGSGSGGSGSGGSGTSTVSDPGNSPSVGGDNPGSSWQSSGEAQLDLGEAINLRLKKIAALANGVSEETTDGYTVYNTTDSYITAITWSSTAPTEQQKVKYGQLGMTSSSVVGDNENAFSSKRIVSDVPIYAWYDNGTIYIYSTDSTIQLHPHSERMFEGMTALTDISGIASHLTFATSGNAKLGTLRYMFKDTAITSFTGIGWDVSSVTNELSYLSGTGNTAFYKMCNGIQSGSHPTFSNPAGSWDSEGTFNPGVVSGDTLVDKLVALGNDMPSTYGYSVNYSVTIENTVKKYTYNSNTYEYDLSIQNVSTTVSDWDLFYCDGQNAYLIAKDFVPNATVSGETNRRILDANQDDTGIFFGFNNPYGVSGSKLTESEKIGPTWTSTLSTAANWTQFVDSTYAVEAYGAPSINMWLASWNAKYPSNQLTEASFGSNNVIIQEGQNIGGNSITSAQATDRLYFNANKHVNDDSFYKYPVSGYPSNNENRIYNVDIDDYNNKNYIGLNNGVGSETALRPVIKLKADVLGTIDSTNGTITLGE